MKPGTGEQIPCFSFFFFLLKRTCEHKGGKQSHAAHRGVKLGLFCPQRVSGASLTIDSDLPRGLGNPNQGHRIEPRFCREGKGSRERLKFHSSCQKTLKKHITQINPFMIHTYIFMPHAYILIPCITSAKLLWFIPIYSKRLFWGLSCSKCSVDPELQQDLYSTWKCVSGTELRMMSEKLIKIYTQAQ